MTREPVTRAIRDFGPSRKRLGRERSSELGEITYHLSHIYFYNLRVRVTRKIFDKMVIMRNPIITSLLVHSCATSPFYLVIRSATTSGE